MAISKLIIMFIASVGSTIGYAIPVEAPKRSLIPAALSSGFAYLVYLKIWISTAVPPSALLSPR